VPDREWTLVQIGYVRGVVASSAQLVQRGEDFAGPLTDYWRETLLSLLDALEASRVPVVQASDADFVDVLVLESRSGTDPAPRGDAA